MAPPRLPGLPLALEGQPVDVIVMRPVRIPAGTVDGAVAELAEQSDGIITAEIRIPAHQPEAM